MATLLRTDLRLYDSSNNGEVVCERHAKQPSDIHHWTRLSMEDASEWVAYIKFTGRTDPCEWCRDEARAR